MEKELSHSWEVISGRYAYDFIMIDLEHYRDTGEFSNVNAEQKKHYRFMDQRSCENNLQYLDDNKVYIGRGLEVEDRG